MDEIIWNELTDEEILQACDNEGYAEAEKPHVKRTHSDTSINSGLKKPRWRGESDLGSAANRNGVPVDEESVTKIVRSSSPRNSDNTRLDYGEVVTSRKGSSTSDQDSRSGKLKQTVVNGVDQLLPLQMYRNGYLWVSDVTSQCWCEQQLIYKLTLPVEVVESPVITAGTDLHLARELEVQDTIKVKITSDEDIFAIKVLNLLGAINSFLVGIPVRREIPIFGAPFGQDVFLVGLIDEIRCDLETFDFDLLELKTRSTRSLPSKAQSDMHGLQVMLYKKLFDDLIQGKTNIATIQKHLNLDFEQEFGPDVQQHIAKEGEICNTLNKLLETLFERMKCIPCISQLLVEYCYQGDKSTIGVTSVEYDEVWLTAKLSHYFSYWKGAREAAGVDIEDAWKCQRCDFADVCEWRQRKASECARNNRL